MSAPHHGSDAMPDELRMRKLESQQSELWKRFENQKKGTAKRTYSKGRTAADDDGDIAFVVGPDDSEKFVKLDFGKAVHWVGLSPETAVELAQLLIMHARAISKKPIVVQLH